MENIKNLTSEEKDEISKLAKVLEEIIPAFKELSLIEDPSEEEKQLKLEYALMIKNIMPIINTAQLLLTNQLFQQSQDFVLNAKLQGEKGNEEMMKFYQILKESYHAALKENLGEN